VIRILKRSALGAVLLLWAAEGSATTAIALSNRAMTDQADVVVIGRATDTRSAWEGRVLVTLVTVAVTETLKGVADSTITVTLPGGIDANRRVPVAMTYPAAPSMGLGEEVFLFLARDEADVNRLTVVGFSQGKFSINPDPTGEPVVTRDLTRLRLVGGTGVTRGAKDRVTLAEFKREIRGYLEGSR
jgi:hypothetical protein